MIVSSRFIFPARVLLLILVKNLNPGQNITKHIAIKLRLGLGRISNNFVHWSLVIVCRCQFSLIVVYLNVALLSRVGKKFFDFSLTLEGLVG